MVAKTTLDQPYLDLTVLGKSPVVGSPQSFCLTSSRDGHSAVKNPSVWACGNGVYVYLQVWKEKDLPVKSRPRQRNMVS